MSTVATTRFSVIDEFAHMADLVGSSIAMHFEAKVVGHFDLDALRRAVRDGASRHPMACARMAPSRGRDRYWVWELPGDFDIDPVTEVTGPDALERARDLALHVDPSLAQSPPFRIWVVRQEDGDVLVVAVNHAPFDAIGFVRLLQSIGRASSGAADPMPEVDLHAARDISRLVDIDGVSRFERIKSLAKLARDPAGPPGRIARDGGTKVRRVATVSRAIPSTRVAASGLTTTDVLVTAFNLAAEQWNRQHGEALNRVSIYVPINLRDDAWRHELVANFGIAASVTTLPAQRSSATEAGRVVARQMRRFRDRSAAADLSPAMFATAGLPLWLRRAAPLLEPLAGRALDTAVLTNVGRVPDIDFGGSAGRVVALWGSSPIRMPIGVGIMTMTTGDTLHLGFRYELRQFDSAAAERFADLFVATIDEVTNAAP